jgi:hypothetical protein
MNTGAICAILTLMPILLALIIRYVRVMILERERFPTPMPVTACPRRPNLRAGKCSCCQKSPVVIETVEAKENITHVEEMIQ